MVQIIEITVPELPLDQAALEQLLQRSPYWSVRQLVCQVDRDQVILRGTVPSYYMKQVAQSLAAKACGEACVQSDIEVHYA